MVHKGRRDGTEMGEKIYRVRMATLTASVEDVPEKWKLLGGRGLTSTIVAQEVKPTCHPLGRHENLPNYSSRGHCLRFGGTRSCFLDCCYG
jgi:hypothetical protein